MVAIATISCKGMQRRLPI